jgi:UPF0716 family protein affecting phage T7 exclusion
MIALAICLIVLGAGLSAMGTLRLLSSRRRVLAPGEVPRSSGLPILVTGDVAFIAGVLLLVL